MKKTFILPFFIIIFTGILTTLSLPFLAINETKYLSVAWDMKNYNSFIIPLLNSFQYPDKPPFLFWLINLDWHILGLNRISLRFIPVIFSLLNLIIVHKISMKLFNNKKIALYSILILSSSLIYLVWSSLIMFDVILTFWVLLGILSLTDSFEGWTIRSFFVFAVAITGGLLTKGPVIFVHLIPVALLSFLWISDKTKKNRWYAIFSGALLTGIILILVWLVPAILEGQKEYIDAILWKQTAGRVVSSFAHQHPLLWYIPFIPVILLPWGILIPSWSRTLNLKNSKQGLFLILWISSVFIILSLISGKQIYYLIPVLPATSILMAYNIVNFKGFKKNSKYHYPLIFLFFLYAAAFLILPKTSLGPDIAFIDKSTKLILGLLFFLIGLSLLIFKPNSEKKFMGSVFVSSFIFISLILGFGHKALHSFDINDIASVIKQKENQGYNIVYFGKYHGQYNFLGELTKPVKVFRDKKSLLNFYKKNNKIIFLDRKKNIKKIPQKNLLWFREYKNSYIVLLSKEEILNFLKQ